MKTQPVTLTPTQSIEGRIKGEQDLYYFFIFNRQKMSVRQTLDDDNFLVQPNGKDWQ